jgi:copper transport protein
LETILTGNLGPLDARQVVLTLANSAAGVEPIARQAYKPGDGTWRIDAVTIPLPGLWSVRLDITTPDAAVVTLEDQIEIRP